MERYLDENGRLAGVVSLVDGRHPPTPLDRRMVEWLADRRVPALVVLTKADKVGRAGREPRLHATAAELGLDTEQVVWFSSRTGEGRNAVFAALRDLVERYGRESA